MPDISFVQPGPLASVALGIKARLDLIFPPEKFVFQWMPPRIDVGVWQKLTRRAPMIGIGFNRFHSPRLPKDLAVISDWTVYLVTRNEAGSKELLFGDPFAPGQFMLSAAAGAILHGTTLPGLGTIQVTEAANSFVEDFKENDLSLTAIELSVPVCLTLGMVLDGAGTEAADLMGQTIQWSFDGSAIVQTDATTIPRGTT